MGEEDIEAKIDLNVYNFEEEDGLCFNSDGEKKGNGNMNKKMMGRLRNESVTRMAMKSKGVYDPPSAKDSTIKELRKKNDLLEKQLETERALNFRREQDKMNRQRGLDENANREIAAQSRKLHEMRVNHTEELKRQANELESRVMDQIAKRKGNYYNRMEEEMMAILQGEINVGHGNLLDKMLMATRNFVQRQCEEGYGDIYNLILEKAEAKIEKDFQVRRGNLYEKVTVDVRGEILKEIHEEQQELRAKILDEEHKFYKRYDKVVKEAKETLMILSKELRTETSKVLENQESDAMERYASEISILSNDWLCRWEEREKEWVKQLENVQKTFMESQLENTQKMTTYSKTLLDKINANNDTQEARIENLFTELYDRIESKEQENGGKTLKRIQEQAEQFRNALETYQANVSKREESQHQAYKTEVDHINELIHEEQKRYEYNLESIKSAQQRERENYRRLLELEKKQNMEERERFETELRSHFTSIRESQETERKREAKERLQNAVETLTTHADMERQKLDLFNEAQKAAEEATKQRVQKLLEDAHSLWEKKEIVKREEEVGRVKAQYEFLLTKTQEKLHLATELNVKGSESWNQANKTLYTQQLENMIAFENKCKEIFDNKLKAFINETEKNMELYRIQVEEMTKKLMDEKSKHHDELIATKMQCKRDMMAQIEIIEKDNEKVFREMEAKHADELEKLADELLKATKALTKERSNQYIESQEEFISRMNSVLGQPALDRHRQAIFNLWDDVGLDTSSRLSFCVKILNVVKYTPEILNLFQGESDRLCDLIPLNKLCTQREYLCFRIKCLQNQSKDPHDIDNEKNDDEKLSSPKAARDVLMAELQVLNTTLCKEIIKYEKKHNQPFSFDSHPNYLQLIIEQQRNVMPEIAHAHGPVEINSEIRQAFQKNHLPN